MSGGPVRRKVAVLGGGVGAVVAAFELTQQPGWQEHYEITVYQLGWRLGGKGASGRDRAKGHRILEHGLHIWCGFYDNAFRSMRAAYEAAGRGPEVPIRSVEQAFTAVDEVYLSDLHEDAPHIWRIDFPPNDDVPGTGGVLVTPRALLQELVEGLRDLVERFPLPTPGALAGSSTCSARCPTSCRGCCRAPSGRATRRTCTRPRPSPADCPRPARTGHCTGCCMRCCTPSTNTWGGRRATAAPSTRRWPRCGRHWKIGAACAKGLIADRVLQDGFDPLDEQEWSAWVMQHGASRRALESAAGRCAYDYVFGVRGGQADFAHRAVAAGAAMRAMLRLLFTYKGSLFFKLNAGMGDIVFAPYYEALRARGVQFRFFHRVTGLGLSADGRHVETIAINRQATLREGDEYRPLYTAPDGLPCWPSEPLFEQLVEGDELRARGVDLESYWSGWPGEDLPPLQRGTDFDLVVLGISLGALPYVTPELAQRLPAWQAMLEHVKCVPTQAMQFWFKPDLQQLGWPDPSGVMTAYYEPMDTWADMSFLLPREHWGDDGPRQISYFCSPFAPTGPAPTPAHGRAASDYAERQLDAVRAGVQPWLDRRLPQILPGTEGARGRFDRGLLYAPGATTPQQCLDWQYLRVNVDPPSELYVQSLPGSTRHRLAADASGVANLFLAGDWVRTGLNAGCVEAAAMAGLQAARAISGRDIPIVGESDFADSPYAAQNAPLPWSLAYAEGRVAAAIVTLALPAHEVARLLPAGVTMLAQTVTPPGTHPVGLIFAEQREVRASVLPFGGMAYSECAVAVPFVTLADGSTGGQPLMVLPALYLDRLLPTLAGRLLYGLRKHLARVDGAAAQQTVRTLWGAPVLGARLHADGAAGSNYDFEQLAAVRAMMDQPIVTHDPLRGWLFSFMDYRFEQARITPLRGQVEVAAGTLGAPQAAVWPVNSLRTAAAGAFLFDGGWTLTNPLQSWELRREIVRRCARR
jgi:uncharacterized protein with NAD-binding domain and iron-sulfur cluster